LSAVLWQAAVTERAATAAPATRIVRRTEVIGPGPQKEVCAPVRGQAGPSPDRFLPSDDTTQSRALAPNMP
jgi:hypothetical protein